MLGHQRVALFERISKRGLVEGSVSQGWALRFSKAQDRPSVSLPS